MRKPWVIVLLAVALAAVSWLAYAANRARADRVTLVFQEADLAEVVRALERQTWETVLVQPGVTRKITIHVKNVPLARALELIATQADCEWAKVLAVHRSSSALALLDRRIASAESSNTWTNYPAATFRLPGFRPFTGEQADSELVSYSAENKPAPRVASDLSRFSKAVVVLEDGIHSAVSLSLRAVTVEDAAETLAKKVGASVARRYVLRPLFKEKNRPPMPPPELHTRALPDEVRKAFESGKPVQIRFEPKEGMQLTPAPEDMFALPPPDPEMEKQRLQRKTVDEIRNSTPEQRLERLRQIQKAP